MKNFVAGCLLALAVAVPAAGQTLNISLPGLLGGLTVDLEGGTGLNILNLGVSVQLVSPLNPGLRARLPQTVSIPLGLAVVVRIEPLATSSFSFNGVASVQLLSLLAPSSPRMYAASSGDNFEDITASTVKLGSSYRVLGSKGGFSEFLIVSDHTPADVVHQKKLDHLDRILADNAGAIAGAVHDDLAAQLAVLRDHVEGGQTEAAIQDVNIFLTTVTQHSGTDIPDVWRATRDVVNVAGQLRAGGETLRFSLQQELGH